MTICVSFQPFDSAQGREPVERPIETHNENPNYFFCFFFFTHSTFDVGRSMFDAHFFSKPSPAPQQKKILGDWSRCPRV